MIDFHSHIVFDVDDGARSIDDSIKILKEAEKAGFDRIILTPHYMDDYYMVPCDEISKKIEELREQCKNENINIELYQGNEIYISNHIDEYVKEGKACSLNNSRYLLFETALNIEPQNLLEVIYKIKGLGKVPVLAHPERYSYIKENPNKLLEIFKYGVLFQANYGSIIGQYGDDAKKTVKQLLKNNFIHFLGSDVHREGNIYKHMGNVMDELKKIVSDEKINELTTENIEKVLNNEEIEVEEPLKIKQGFFSKFF